MNFEVNACRTPTMPPAVPATPPIVAPGLQAGWGDELAHPGPARERLRSVAAMLLARQAELDTEIAGRLEREIPQYKGSNADVLEHIGEHVSLVARKINGGARITLADYDFVEPHAAARAEDGLPLSAFLHSFRIGVRVLWDAALSDAGEDLGARAATLPVATRLLEFFNLASTRASEAYVKAQEAYTAQGANARRDLLERLLAGRPLSRAAMLALAADAGLTQGARYVVIVATEVGLLQRERRQEAVSALLRAATGVVRPLSLMRRDELVIVTPLLAEDLERLSHRLRAVHAQLLTAGATIAVGVSTAYPQIALAPAAYTEARAAAESLGSAGGVQALLEMGPLDYFAARADEVSFRLVPEAVRTFVSEDLARDGALIGTVLAYAAADMNLMRTASAMHVHVNTVRYRLARISERTACDPRRLADVLDLVVAIKMLTARQATEVAPRSLPLPQ